MEDPRALDPSAEGVDAALRLGFGGEDTSLLREESVLRALDSKLGEAPRRLLREELHGDAGSPPVTGTDEFALPPGSGRYRVIGELARGGMGVVLKAHDADLCRDVALKVLSRRLARDPALISRFVEEAQVGGQLQHPGIVPVFELGLMADDQPYIAMKLVKGRTLSNLLSERKSPSSELRRFLGIFEQVCQTVAYAHSRGVIHRDLKPANVMVGAFGEVQVVDWGLAKVLRAGGTADEQRAKSLASEVSVIETVRSGEGSGGSASRVGSVMGTPAYMAPEQARGEVQALDERTDVFALGAVLCEVLTGRPPYLGEGEETVLQAADAKLDGALRRLAQCGADAALVELCGRCLRPARGARPRNAEAVASEVGAYLASVEERAQAARDEAAAARGRAFAERKARRVTVALASSLLLAGVAGVVGWRTVEGRERTRIERVEGEVQAALDEALEARGDDRLADASSAAKRAQSLAAAERVGGGLEARARELASAIADEEEAARATRERAARDARFLAQLERVRLIEPHDPLEEFERGEDDWHGAPEPLSAEERANQWERRAAAYARVFAEHDLATAADDDQLVKRIAAGDVALEIALALDDWARVLRKLDGREGEARRLVGLAKRVDTDNWRRRMRDALVEDDIAALLAMAGDPRAAELPAVSLFLLGQLLANEGQPDAAVELLSMGVEAYPGDFALHVQLGRTLRKLDPPRLEEAVRHFTAGLALRPESALALGGLGKARGELGESEGARVALERVVRLDPGNAWMHRHLAHTLDVVGDLPAALAAQREALNLEPEVWRIRSELAFLLMDAGEPSSGVEQGRAAVRLAPESAWARAALGFHLTRAGDPAGGLEAAREAIELDPDGYAGHHAAGAALLKLQRLDDALQAFRDAAQHASPREAPCLSAAQILLNQGHREDARAAAEEILSHHPKHEGARIMLAKVANRTGDPEQAVAICEQVLAENAICASAMSELGNAYAVLGNLEAAIQWYERSLELQPNVEDTLSNLGQALANNDRALDSLEFFRRALEILPDDPATLAEYSDALAELDELDKALEVAERSYALAPGHLLNEFRLGILLYRNRSYARAVEHLYRASEQDPAQLDAWGLLGESLIEVDRLEDAVSVYERLSALAPHACFPLHRLGDLWRRLGDVELGATILWESIDANPDCQEGYWLLAELEQERGSYAAAADVCRQALERDPRNPWTLNELAWLLVEVPSREPYDPDEAVVLAEQLVEVDSAERYAWNTLGVARYRAGDHAGAREALERSVELGPADAWDWLFLAMARQRLGDEEQASADFERAQTWLRAQSSVEEELIPIEREARQVLGIPVDPGSGR